jgi:hypothetical protein
MTDVPEATIEAESGYDYTQSYDYTYGLLVTELLINAPVQRLGIDHPTADVQAEGTADINAPTQALGVDHPTAELIEEFVVDAPVQRYGVAHPTADVTGEGDATINAPVQRLGLEWLQSQIGFTEWVLDDAPVGRITAETATNTTLSLTTRATSTALETDLRPLKTDEGKVDVLGTDDGGFVAIDRADGGNTFTLIPPVRRQPLRQQETVHVQRYEETLVSQEVGEWNVTVEFAREEDRTDTPSVSESPAADEWGFSTRYGEIATARVDADVVGTGESGVDRFRLTTRLTMDQAHVFEAALARLGAGRVREIPDAGNVAVDDSTDNAVTVTVDAPDSQDTVADGDYIVTSWESSRLTDAYQEVEFTIASK